MEKGDWRRGCIGGRDEGKAEVERRGGGGCWEVGAGLSMGLVVEGETVNGRGGRGGMEVEKKEAGGRREEGEEEGSS